ncbi:dihydroorotase [Acidiplasma aeolicum]|uniref:Dihydroorotase n=2 Tax=Acidiplasma aeolicum TaxID=507754 RepID=A0A0P9CJQ5_9ARCH|nr:dihydroorotase [Acidiplasma aeolicum]KPV45898.1 dihydroorotase [Acidiplasma aeolicum]
MYDTVFSGKFYYNGQFQDLDIGVCDGKITEIKKHINFKREILRHAVFPAGTDIHVHFRDPGETEKEDFKTGTISAIAGGTTTIFDMPNNKIKIDNYSAYRDKLEIVRRKAYSDFGLYSMFTGNNLNIIDKDSSGIKIYMGSTTNASGLNNYNASDINGINDLKIPVVFHAEDPVCLQKNHIDAKNLMEYNKSRPPECEDSAVSTASKMGFKNGIIAHLTHNIKTQYLREVTPHHLMLNDEMDLGSYGKVNPPLRSRELQGLLLDEYISGSYDILSSDHAPHTQNEKADFEYAPAGIIGVETRIPLMLALIQKKVLPMDVFIKTAIYNPAKIFNIKKGEIKIGNYADFMTVDFTSMERLNDYRLHSKNPESPFNGFDVIFPDDVIMRGIKIVSSREIIEDHTGKYIRELK